MQISRFPQASRLQQLAHWTQQASVLIGFSLAVFLLAAGWVPPTFAEAGTSPSSAVKTAALNPAEPLPVGIKAPAFGALPVTGGGTLSLSDLAGQPFVLVFYPMDFTSGCTAQLCALRDSYAEFQKRGVRILASNPGDLKSHTRFVAHHQYPFPIVVDKDSRMAKAYHSSGFMGFNKRTVYVVDAEGDVRFAQRGNPSPGKLLKVIDGFQE